MRPERQHVEALLTRHADADDPEDAAALDLDLEYVAEHGHEAAFDALDELCALLEQTGGDVSDPVIVVVARALEIMDNDDLAWADGAGAYADPEVERGAARAELRRFAPQAFAPVARPVVSRRHGARARGAGTPAGRASSRSSSRGGDSGDDGSGSSPGDGDPPPPPPVSDRPELLPAQNDRQDVEGRFGRGHAS